MHTYVWHFFQLSCFFIRIYISKSPYAHLILSGHTHFLYISIVLYAFYFFITSKFACDNRTIENEKVFSKEKIK